MASTQTPQPLRFAGAARLRSFTNFSLLPYDIQTTIIVTSCRLRQTYETPPAIDNNRHPVVLLDVNTTKSLALVNKTFNLIVTRTLYEKIHVTRPSTLRSLAVSIYDRPELGRFVKSLHIGPANPLPKDWLPIQNGNLALSMSALTDKEQRPSWLSTPHLVAITYPHDAHLSPSTKAISSAILSASRSLDVLLASEGCDRRGWEIPKNMWYHRALMVYTAIELYVIEMVRLERAAKSEGNHQGEVHYPRLIVTTMPTVPSANTRPSSDAPVLKLSNTDLRARLAASHGKADRFDHPLLFAQSSLPWQAEGPDGDLRREGSSKWLRKGGSEVAFDSLPYRHDLSSLDSGCVRGILTLAQELLARTPLLEQLSLTGFLERAICGSRAPTDLRSLQSLSLGPPPGRWSWAPPLRPSESILAGLHSLRVCGFLLRKEQIAGLIGTTMPRLQSFQWSYAKQITDAKSGEGTSRLLDVISILVGHDLVYAEQEDDMARSIASVLKRTREASSSESDHDELSIEVHLHARDVACILNAAPDLATRAAWLEGAMPPADSRCRRRLKVAEIGTTHNDENEVAEHRAQMGAMYAEGREWFEEGDRLEVRRVEG